MKQQLLQWGMGAGGALVLSAAVRGLPAPQPMGNTFYLWFYNFTHLVLANFDKLGPAK
jgi:hypothetical protein